MQEETAKRLARALHKIEILVTEKRTLNDAVQKAQAETRQVRATKFNLENKLEATEREVISLRRDRSALRVHVDMLSQKVANNL